MQHTLTRAEKRHTVLINRLKKELLLLRRAYKSTIQKKDDGVGEWLRDNFYLIEREGKNALRELKRSLALPVNAQGYPYIYLLCEKVASGKSEHLEENLMGRIRKSDRDFSTRELESILIMLKVAAVHFAYLASRRDDLASVAMIGAAVGVLREMASIDLDEIVEEFSEIERIFLKDPAGIYGKMDENTRRMYRRVCSRLVDRENMDEITAATNILHKAEQGGSDRERHVGYYLLEGDSKRRRAKKGWLFIWIRLILPLLLTGASAYFTRAWWLCPLLYFPLFEVVRPIADYFMTYKVEPYFMPRMKLEGIIPKSSPTLVMVSTLVPSADKAEGIYDRLRQLYKTNGQGEVKFCVLADMKQAATPIKPEDALAVDALGRVIHRLNREYDNKFILIVRPRVHIKTQGAFAGFERKRGAITQLIRCIKGDRVEFAATEGDMRFLHTVKYLIALDADTELLLDCAAGLVSAALHPLNRPEVNKDTGRVTKGYGIITPKISNDLHSSAATPFSRVMAGVGGVTAYDLLSGDIYQDLFSECVFAGKGLIDVSAFYDCMNHSLPSERVLSHDILEGGFLRAGYMSDVEVTDGCPSGALSWLSRLHRWIRGDWQNILWLGRKVPCENGKIHNPLRPITKYMLFDNLRRSLTYPAALLCILAVFFIKDHNWLIITAALLGITMPPLFSAITSLVSGGIQMISRKYYSRVMPEALTCLAQGLFHIILLTQNAYISIDAIARSLWRQLCSRKNLLEWVTSADSDKQGGSFVHTLKKCIPSLLVGGLLLLHPSSLMRLCGVLAIFCPILIHLTKRPSKKYSLSLSADERDRLKSYAAAMWQYYDQLCTAADNYLPPDNIQESPVHAVAHRTSPTNIGLMLLCTLAARDLGFIETSTMCLKISRALESVEKCEKWKGHLLNWYDTKTLKPLSPRFVSTVDSGNFACCLLALKSGLMEYKSEAPEILDICEQITVMLDNIDLRPLYKERRHLFHIGYDLETETLSNSYYDLLMSEARMTSYYAIASRQVPKKHWGYLGRTLASEGSYTGPVSWTGTMFEYFMPHLLLPVYENSLGFEAVRFCAYCQRKKAKQKNTPYGCSESGFFAFDQQYSYQYKAHGIQRLGLKRRLGADYVVSPYSSFLTLLIMPHAALKNLSRLERMHMTGRYGFYEAIDFTPGRAGALGYSIVRSYMAHHVGMSLIATLNALRGNCMQRRFMNSGSMSAAEELLKEKIPVGSAVFDDVIERDVPEKPGRGTSSIEEYEVIDPRSPRMHLLSGGGWTLCVTDSGASVSISQGVDITRRSEDLLRQPQGVFAAVEGGGDKFFITQAPDYHSSAIHRAEFASSYAAFYGKTAKLEAGMQVMVHPTLQCEQRKFMIKNTTGNRIASHLLVYFEPALAKPDDDQAHPAFSKLFLKSHYDEKTASLVFTRRLKNNETPIYLAVGFSDAIAFEYECDRESLLRRPVGVESVLEAAGRPLTCRAGIPDMGAALRIPLDLPAKSQKSATLIMAAAATKDEALSRLISCRSETCKSQFKGAPSPLFNGGLESRVGQNVMPSLFFPAKESRERILAARENERGQNALWEMAISGDFPIVVCPIDSPAQVMGTEPYIRFHKRIYNCGVKFDLVLLLKEGGDYAQPITDGLKRIIHTHSNELLIGQNGGLHIVDQARYNPSAITALLAAARHIAPESGFTPGPEHAPYTPLRIAESSPPDSPLPEGLAVTGGVFSDGSFTITTRPQLPWCHILSNERFGTLVSDCALGYSWAGNSRENKLTPWFNDTRYDNRGEMLILKTGGRYFDLIAGSRATYYSDKAVYTGQCAGIRYQVEVTVPETGSRKIVDVTFHNKGDAAMDFQAAYYTEPVLGVNRKNARQITSKWENGALTLHNPWNTALPGVMMLTVKDGADEFVCSRPAFLSGQWKQHTLCPLPDPCAAVIVERHLPPRRQEKVSFILSFGETADRAAEEPGGEAVKRNRYKIKTPNEGLNHLINTWLPAQIENARVNGRTAFYQCGGAYGYRDQLQDICAMCYYNPEDARKHIIRAAAHQFEEGDALHWWHPLTPGNAGVRTRCSDDMLWLPYAVCEYMDRTGDTSVLEEEVPFVTGKLLAPHEQKRYFVPGISSHTASVYDHCLKAIGCITLGDHGLPLIGNCDWNDGFSNIGSGGKGESVWLAQFSVIVCERMAGVCLARGDSDRARELLDMAGNLKQAVDDNAWDGEWYLRAFFDDGRPLGQKGAPECEIDLLPQAFAVLSGMSDKVRVRTAMDNALQRLVDEEIRIIKLFAPAFDGILDPGYISAYAPGVRENGGQYTHSAIWLSMALFKEGRPDEGYRLLQMISPVERYMIPELAEKYKAEPYSIPADVYGCDPIKGRGGWTLYTGAAGWYYRTVLTSMLGIYPNGGRLAVSPSLPSDWDGYEADIHIGGAKINLRVVRGKEPGLTVDGAPAHDIPVHDGEYEVVCTIPES